MIDFLNVSKIYDNGNVGLQEVNLHIEKGEFVFVIGPTGSGKSTLINLILRELKASEGEVLFDGEDLADLSNREVAAHRRKLGIVFQDEKLLANKTVYENIALAMEVVHTTKRTIRRQIPQMLDMVGIPREYANKFPSELSGGEQQRVAIARAIVNHPELIIADEPTGSVDPEMTKGLMDLFADINRHGTTVIIVTHNREIVDKMGKRVVVIDEGRIISDEERGEYKF